MSKTIFATVVILLVTMNAYGESEVFRKKLAEAENGNVTAQSHLAMMYREGEGVSQNYKEAAKWYTKAAEQGNVNAQFNLGIMYHTGVGVAHDYKQAVSWYRMAAEQGHADAQFNIGWMFSNGQGLIQNSEEAVKWYAKAAEQNNAKAQAKLGFCYYFGEGVKQDFELAVKWGTKAAERGMVEAQFFLGTCYSGLIGDGVEQNYEQAIKWYTKAAEQGDVDAKKNLIDIQARLGDCYFTGNSVEQDYKEAVKWYRKAAEQGNARAQGILGMCYYLGQGVVEDYVEAYKWILLAGMNGHDVLEPKIWLQEKLSSEGIAEAQKQAKAFTESKKQPVKQPNSQPQVQSSGTGFFVDTDGYMVTACHVVEEAKSIVVITSYGRFYAEVVAKDENNDIAILKVQGTGFSSLNIASSSEVKTGDKVFTVGFPNIDVQGTEVKYTEGSISSLSGINNDFRYFQISVPVQPGNSGGPLMDSNGNVIGIVVSKLSDTKMLLYKGTIPQNVNYAVKSSFVLPYLKSIHGIETSGKTDKVIAKQTAIPKSKNATALILCY